MSIGYKTKKVVSLPPCNDFVCDNDNSTASHMDYSYLMSGIDDSIPYGNLLRVMTDEQLRELFEEGDIPTNSDFVAIIDSKLNKADGITREEIMGVLEGYLGTDAEIALEWYLQEQSRRENELVRIDNENARIESMTNNQSAFDSLSGQLQSKIDSVDSAVSEKLEDVDGQVEEIIGDVNAAIASGTIDLEVKMARKNIDGVVFPSLKDRLDADSNRQGGGGDVDLTDYYTKSETNGILDNKADKVDTYTKTEVDDKIANVQGGESIDFGANNTWTGTNTYTNLVVNDRNGEVQKMMPTTSGNACYYAFYKNRTNRSGYFGYESSTNNHFVIVNESSNSDINIKTAGTGKVQYNGSEVAKKSELHTHSNKTTLDGITDAKVTEWNNKSTFDGNYNSLTNKPAIPVVDVTKSYVDTALTNKADKINTYTKSEVDTKIAEASLEGGEVDLSGYATKDDLVNKSDVGHTHNEYASKSNEHTHSNKSVIDNISSTQIIEWNAKANITDIPTNTSELINDSNFITQHQDISHKADKTYVDGELSKKSDIHNHPYKAESYIPSWGEITSKPSSFNPATHTHTEYASKSSEHIHSNKSVLDGISSTKIAEWDNKSTFDGNYNSLTNKPTIPSTTGLTTKTYVDTELAKKSDTHTHPYRLDTWLPPNDHGHANKTVLDGISSAKVTSWDNKSTFDGNYNSLTNKPTIPTVDVNKAYVDTQLANKSNIEHLHEEYTTESRVSTMIAEASLEGGDVDLSGYATKDDLNTKADIHNHPYKSDSYVPNWSEITSKPSSFNPSTHTHVKSDITDFSHTHTEYASKSSEHTHSNKATLDGISSAKVTEWNNKSTFSGNYNDLTNKPTIPSITGLTTKTYVDTELAKKSDTHTHPYKSSSYVPNWSEITNKPSTFNPTTHRHDASEIDNLPTGGDVDLTDYYNKTETDILINDLDVATVKAEDYFGEDIVIPSPIYATKSYVDTELVKKSNEGHLHTNYYNKTETDTLVNDLDIATENKLNNVQENIMSTQENMSYVGDWYNPVDIKATTLGTDGIPSSYSKENYEGFLDWILNPLVADFEEITKTNLGLDTSMEYNVYRYEFTPKNYDRTIILCSNVHGNEFTSFYGACRFLDEIYRKDKSDSNLYFLRHKTRIIFMPIVNPWGFCNSKRQNFNGVDLNRNTSYKWDDFNTTSSGIGQTYYKGTAPWSEIESQYIKQTVEEFVSDNLVGFVDLHTITTIDAEKILYYPRFSKNAFTEFRNVLDRFNPEVTENRTIFSSSAVPTFSNWVAHTYNINACNPEWVNSVYGGTRTEFLMRKHIEFVGNIFLSLAKKPQNINMNKSIMLKWDRDETYSDVEDANRMSNKGHRLLNSVNFNSFEWSKFNFELERESIVKYDGHIKVYCELDCILEIEPLVYQQYSPEQDYSAMSTEGRFAEKVRLKAGQEIYIPINAVLHGYHTNYNDETSNRSSYCHFRIRAKTNVTNSVWITGYKCNINITESNVGRCVEVLERDSIAYNTKYPIGSVENIGD